jgi:phosphoribosyl-ATP pyrophosphohydrolase
MSKYLLLKLAEEAGEVVVAAIKHRLHGTERTKRELEGEIADFIGVTNLLIKSRWVDGPRVSKLAEAREKREKKRIA